MNVTSTAIAVALALVVVIGVFVFGFPLFQQPQSASSAVEQTPGSASTTPPAPAMTMPTTTPVTELKVSDDIVGTGAVAVAGDSVTVQYVGALADGTIFDASSNHGAQGFTFTLGGGQVIKGWDEGVAGMKEGGVRTLIIPPSLGYGAQGAGNVIPPNATLVFKVQLVKVQKPR